MHFFLLQKISTFYLFLGNDYRATRYSVRGRVFQMSPPLPQRIPVEAPRAEDPNRDLAPEHRQERKGLHLHPPRTR